MTDRSAVRRLALGRFLSSTGSGIAAVAGTNIIQRHATDAVRARVFAAQGTAGLTANMVGLVVVGPLVQALGPRAVYGLGAGVALIATLTFVIPTSRVPVPEP